MWRHEAVICATLTAYLFRTTCLVQHSNSYWQQQGSCSSAGDSGSASAVIRVEHARCSSQLQPRRGRKHSGPFIRFCM